MDNTEDFPLHELYCEWIACCSFCFLRSRFSSPAKSSGNGPFGYPRSPFLYNIYIACVILAKKLPLGKLRPAYLIINVAVYLIQLLVWVCSWIGSSSVFIEISELLFAVFSFLAALGFVVYGGRLFFLLRRFPIQSRGRQKKMFEVGSVTSICCICFVIRSGVVAYSAFNKGADLDVLDNPILNFIYYMLVEVIPSSLVLFILRKLPPRRSSEQYHPIS